MYDFEKVKLTFVENWPRKLFTDSIANMFFTLSPEEAKAMLAVNQCSYEYGETDEEKARAAEPIIKRISEKIDGYVKQLPRGAFVRLGSRSPKDSYVGYKEGFCCHDGDKAIRLFCDSERIHDDLHQALHYSYTPHVVVREWVNIESWQEFRGFIKGRKLVGLSQYNYLKYPVYPELVENADVIEWAIRTKARDIAEILPVDDVVMDFIYWGRKYGNETVSEVKVLEINPWGIWTDPCLFNWSTDDFKKFEFRYCK